MKNLLKTNYIYLLLAAIIFLTACGEQKSQAKQSNQRIQEGQSNTEKSNKLFETLDDEAFIIWEFLETEKKMAKMMPSVSNTPTTAEIERLFNSYVELANQYYVPFFNKTNIDKCSEDFKAKYRDLCANITQDISITKKLLNAIIEHDRGKIQTYMMKKTEIDAELSFIRGSLRAYGLNKIEPFSREVQIKNMNAVIKFITDKKPEAKMDGNGIENLNAFAQLGSDLWKYKNLLMQNSEIHQCPKEFIAQYKAYCNSISNLVEVIRDRPPMPTSNGELLALGLITALDPNGQGRNIAKSLQRFKNRLDSCTNEQNRCLDTMREIAKKY